MKRALAVIVLLSSTACLEPFSNDDVLFLKSVPTRKQVALAVPQGLSSCPMSTSIYYTAADDLSTDVNGAVYSVIDLITQVVQYPPTVRTENARIWGPFDGERGTQIKFTIERVRTATTVQTTRTSTPTFVTELYHYTFEARSTGAFVKVIDGAFAPSADLDSGMGVFLLNFEQNRLEVDPTSNDRGLIYIGYDNRFGQQTTQTAIDAEVNLERPFEQPEGYYYYHEEQNGDRRFDFLYLDTIHDLLPDNAKETFFIRQRYLSDGTGRAEIAATGGDLGDYTVYLTECWDSCFQQTFLASNLPEIPPVGTINACAEPFRSDPVD